MTDSTVVPNKAAQLVRAALHEAGVTAEITVLDGSARTAAEAAAQLNVTVGAIANSLIFSGDGSPVLILTSGAHRVDPAKVCGLLGLQRLDRATPDFVREHTGQAIGGVAPVGHPAPITTLVDTALFDHPQVWAAAGHPHAVFPTTGEELLRITGGRRASVA